MLPAQAIPPSAEKRAIVDALEQLRSAGLPERLVIDASHDNSGKDHRRQPQVANEIADQIGLGPNDAPSLTLPSGSTVSINPGGTSLAYNPAPNFFGSEAFTRVHRSDVPDAIAPCVPAHDSSSRSSTVVRNTRRTASSGCGSGMAISPRRRRWGAAATASARTSISPGSQPDLPGWEIASFYRPSGRTEVGGDFYDAIPLADERWVEAAAP